MTPSIYRPDDRAATIPFSPFRSFLTRFWPFSCSSFFEGLAPLVCSETEPESVGFEKSQPMIAPPALAAAYPAATAIAAAAPSGLNAWVSVFPSRSHQQHSADFHRHTLTD